jgi:hypothetical protein
VERSEIKKCDIRQDSARDAKPEKIKHLFVGRATPGVISSNTDRSLLAELPALNVVFIRGIDSGHYWSPYLSALLKQTAFGHRLFRLVACVRMSRLALMAAGWLIACIGKPRQHL